MWLLRKRAHTPSASALPVQFRMINNIPAQDSGALPPPSTKTAKIANTIQAAGVAPKPKESGEVPDHAGCRVFDAYRNVKLDTTLNNTDAEPGTSIPYADLGGVLRGQGRETPDMLVGPDRGPTTTWGATTGTTERSARSSHPDPEDRT